MKVTIVFLWVVCLISSFTDWLEVESRPAYVPGRPLANLKAFARECVARELGTVKPIKWLKMLNLRQGHIPKTMRVTFQDFSTASVNFIKCLSELQANVSHNSYCECEDVKNENSYLRSLISGFVVNPSASKTVTPLSTTITTVTASSSSSTLTTTHTCPTHPTESSFEDCQFVNAENTILKQQLDNCKSFPSTYTSPPSTDTPSTDQPAPSHIYVWFGFFIGFFVGCLFVIFVNSATYKKIKNTCCRHKKTVEEREREMNTIKNKKGTRKETEKKEKQKEGKKEQQKKEDTKTNTDQTKTKTEKEEISWKEKNKMKQELNSQRPPPRQKKNAPLTTADLIELNTEEIDENKKVINETEKITTEKKKVADEKEKIMSDSVAIMIENV